MHTRPRTIIAILFAVALAGAAAASSAPHQLRIKAELDRPYLPWQREERTYLRIGLHGIPIERPEYRPAVNVSIVIDRSGSMSGEKIRRAREAAAMAVRRLESRDYVSIVTYDSTVQVVVPAMPVGDQRWILKQIDRIEAGGNTALFAGVSKGASELRRYLSSSRVNRVILISDGLANVGPSSPHELGSLGQSLAREGIAVTTVGLGLGYNEDLMYSLAERSDGNHYFAQEPHDLTAAFDREFGQTLSVVAQDVWVEIEIEKPFRPVRILGREGDIRGQTVRVHLNQVYGDGEEYVLVEVLVPSYRPRTSWTPDEKRGSSSWERGASRSRSRSGSSSRTTRPTATSGSISERDIANVVVRYDNMRTRDKARLTSKVQAHFTDSEKLIEKHHNAMVAAEVVKTQAAEKNEEAMRLRDQGRKEEAKRVLFENQSFLQSNSIRLNAPALGRMAGQQEEAAKKLDAHDWSKQRKKMKVQQFEMRQDSLNDIQRRQTGK